MKRNKTKKEKKLRTNCVKVNRPEPLFFPFSSESAEPRGPGQHTATESPAGQHRKYEELIPSRTILNTWPGDQEGAQVS